jgi:hypothetical protein
MNCHSFALKHQSNQQFKKNCGPGASTRRSTALAAAAAALVAMEMTLIARAVDERERGSCCIRARIICSKLFLETATSRDSTALSSEPFWRENTAVV